MPDLPKTPDSGVQRNRASLLVLVRLRLRALVLIVFALASSRGFAPALETLLGLAALYCLLAAIYRRERVFGETLTNFDEAAGYCILAGLARLFT